MTLNSIPERIGRAIMVRRAELRLERKTLAAESFISYPYLSEIETGAKTPILETLAVIAAALGLTASELMARAEQLPALGIPDEDQETPT